MKTILLVDDDPSITASLALLLKRQGYATESASSPAEALARLASAGERISLVLQDMNFTRTTSGEEGFAFLAEIRRRRPNTPVILITAWGSISMAVLGIKAGAADFVTKPWNNAQLLQSIATALALAEDARTPHRLEVSREELDERFDFVGLVGADPKWVRILELVGRVAPTDASVLITGESGTGKELIAEAIHKNSRRRGAPFVKVNLGGISSTLFESEMFGHVRGAFTDARVDRKGRFELASGGTIFLDEIGEVDLSAQVKLLRVLQDRTYEVLGSSQARTVDVRVVSATNRDLGERVASGAFREDLLYRLNLITIRLPPLRERRDDVSLFAHHFLALAARTYRRQPIELAPRALDWLREQPWPGNLRQLKGTLDRATLLLERDRLEVADLVALSELDARGGPELGTVRSGEATGTELPSPGTMTLDQMERAMIEKCLRHFEGNLTRVADALGLSRPALYRRLEKYGLDAQGM